MTTQNDYYQNLLKQYLPNQNQLQKTPQQIADEQKIQAYQVYITTKEGIEAVTELNTKFGNWFEQNYGVKQPVQSNDFKKLEDMVATMAKQIEGLTNQLK
jgi:hypothetical protein